MIDLESAIRFDSVTSLGTSTGESASVCALWTVPPELPYFQGHFPDNPILPAVALIDVTLELIRRHGSSPDIALSQVKSAKMTRPLPPGNQVRIELKLRSPATSTWEALWTLDGSPVANLLLTCR